MPPGVQAHGFREAFFAFFGDGTTRFCTKSILSAVGLLGLTGVGTFPAVAKADGGGCEGGLGLCAVPAPPALLPPRDLLGGRESRGLHSAVGRKGKHR
jgi:hypothetical protein